jgi:hypothetical protein
MTRRIIVERSTREHLRQELTATDYLLSLLIALERSSGLPRLGNFELRQTCRPGRPYIVELVPQQLEPAVVRFS